MFRLSAAAAALACPALSRAVQRRSLDDPLRLAVDTALFESGLAAALQRGFGRDTGVAVHVLRGPATALLEALERGEHDAALTNAPDVETPLDKQGLVHDRRLIVVSEFILVGPTLLAKPLAAGNDIGVALSRLAQAQVPFMTRADGSGTHLIELALWRAAKTAPATPWYLQAPSDRRVLAQAREQNACTVVDRGVWAASAPGGYSVLAEGDPRMAVDVHVMRTFRAEHQHPAGKLFVNWIAGPKGRQLAAAHRGYRAARD